MEVKPGYPLTKKGQRNLPEFATSEQIYGFLRNTIDVETARAVQNNLQSSKELQKQYQQMQDALAYLTKLSRTQVSQEATERLTAPTGAMVWILERIHFHEWPIELRWGVESFIAGAIIGLALLVVPWDRLKEIHFTRKTEIILAEAERHRETSKTAPKDQPQVEPSFQDEGLNLPTTIARIDFWHNIMWPPWFPFTVAPPAWKPTTPTLAQPEPPSTRPKVSVNTTTSPTSPSVASQPQGYLWRGSVKITNVEAISPKIVEKISELGGRKAGEVPLGWKRGQGTYFHFTIPEAKLEDLKAFLRPYGELQIAKERHERVMPDGIVRIIIQADEKAPPLKTDVPLEEGQ